jgi:peptide-methionine (S)-S-oxide reductase
MRLSSFTRLGFAAALLLGAVYLGRPAVAAEDAVVIPPPAQDRLNGEGMQTAVLAGGCFWGVQGVFQHTKGVINAVSGYAGGVKENAEYEKVGTGRTGHAESVQIRYDPTQISYGKLLQIYFSVAHDPTQLNRQGPDSGPQYRSTIFIQNEEQRRVAEAYIAQLNAAKVFGKPIATTIESGKIFFPAEDYHQDYLTLHPYQPYIAYNDIPKVENLKRLFADLYRDKPVLVRDAKDTNKATN